LAAVTVQVAGQPAVVEVQVVLEAVLVLWDKDILQVLVVANQVAAELADLVLTERLRGQTLVRQVLVDPALTLILLLHRFLPN
jgi:hypothetical protein